MGSGSKFFSCFSEGMNQMHFSRSYWCLNIFPPPLPGRIPFPGMAETGSSQALEDVEKNESRVMKSMKENAKEPVYTMPEMRDDYEENEYFTEEDAKREKPQECGKAQEKNKKNLETTVETRGACNDYGRILEYENLF